MAFELFRETSSRGFKPKASVRRNGQIGFNQGVVRRFELNKYPYVSLYYDKDTRIIGVKLHEQEPSEGGIKLTVKGPTSWLSARKFLDFFEIPYAQTRKFELNYDSELNMLVFGPVE